MRTNKINVFPGSSCLLIRIQFLPSLIFTNNHYRPGQPNWENTMWKFQDFSATQILREINFGHFEAPKTAILTV